MELACAIMWEKFEFDGSYHKKSAQLDGFFDQFGKSIIDNRTPQVH